MPDRLRGGLEVVHLASLLQLAEWEGWTGVLVLPEGGMGIFEGAVTTATCGNHAGLLAVYEQFFVTEGEFSLQDGDPTTEAALGRTMDLVLEGTRLVDEWNELAPLVLDGKVDGLPADVVLDGSTPLWLAAQLAGAPRSAMVDPIQAALASSAVRRVGREAPPADGKGPVLDLDELLSEGRRLVKDGDLVGAERTFKLALRAHPGHPIAAQNLRRVQRLGAIR